MSIVQEKSLPAPHANAVCVWMMRLGWLAVCLGGLLAWVLPVLVTVLAIGVGFALCGLSGLSWREYWTDFLLWRGTRNLNASAQQQALDQIATSGWRRVHRWVITVIASGLFLFGVTFVVAGLFLLE